MACDPEAERQEYLKKVAKFLDNIRGSLSNSVQISETDYISPEFKRFINPSNQVVIKDSIAQLNSAMSDKSNVEAVLFAVASLINNLYKSSNALSLPFTAKELTTMRSLIKQTGVTPNQVKEYIYDHFTVASSKAFAKDFRL
jgi:hypothetical protein